MVNFSILLHCLGLDIAKVGTMFGAAKKSGGAGTFYLYGFRKIVSSHWQSAGYAEKTLQDERLSVSVSQISITPNETPQKVNQILIIYII